MIVFFNIINLNCLAVIVTNALKCLDNIIKEMPLEFKK